VNGFIHVKDPLDELAERFAGWAADQANIKGVLLVGSRARKEPPADSMSDLDLLILTTNAEYYLRETDWFGRFGDVLFTFVEGTAIGGQFERRVLYKGGLDVDFNVVPNDLFTQLLEVGFPAEVQDVFRRGFRILVDKDAVLGRISDFSETMTTTPPSLEQLDQHTDDFLYHAVWAEKKLHRGELWTAKWCCDVYMKKLLLRMVEWHARATRGWDYDTWYEGRFLERWADPKVVAELTNTFARYDAEEVAYALLYTIEAHKLLSAETASKLGYLNLEGKYTEALRLVKKYTSLGQG